MTAPTTSRMLADELTTRLAALHTDYGQVAIDVGPQSDERINDYPGAQVVLTRRPGLGLTLEGTYDRIVWAVDVAGDQGDYDGAETLALAVDSVLVAIDHSQSMFADGRIVSFVTRAGGGPGDVGLDDGDRRHLLCAYVIQVQSGL